MYTILNENTLRQKEASNSGIVEETLPYLLNWLEKMSNQRSKNEEINGK